MAITGFQLAYLTARSGCARSGAVRSGYTPKETVNQADTANGPYTPTERIYVPANTFTRTRE